jgi:hypothetical protein
MPLQIILGALKSRAVRNFVVEQAVNQGIRRIAVNNEQQVQQNTNPDDNSGQNFLSVIWNGAKKFAGFLVSNLKAMLTGNFQINLTAIWQKIVAGTTFILNFNWNITDAQLDEQVKQGNIALAASAGGALGNAVGFLVCGGIPAASIAVFNLPLAVHVLEDVSEEAAEEIAGNIAALVMLTSQQLLRYTFSNIYKNFRSVLRPAALGIAQILVSVGILNQDSVDKANKKRNEPWSFASALEDTIEDIKDPIHQAAVESFWEELGEGCIEAGYIVAGSIDGYFAQHRVASQSYFGKEKLIEILPDRSVEPDPQPQTS